MPLRVGRDDHRLLLVAEGLASMPMTPTFDGSLNVGESAADRTGVNLSSTCYDQAATATRRSSDAAAGAGARD